MPAAFSLARPRPNLDVYVMPHTHHNTSQKLKAAGILDQVLMACFDLDRPLVEKVLLDHVQGRLTALPIPEGSATPHIGKTGRA